MRDFFGRDEAALDAAVEAADEAAEAAGWEYEVRDDLFLAGHRDDGTEFHASVFYVIATELETGRRFAHDARFKSAHEAVNEEGEAFISSYRPKALAQAERLLARIQAAQAAGALITPEGREHWSEIAPVYGSSRWEPDTQSRDDDWR